MQKPANAFTIPEKSLARELQRDRQCASTPRPVQHVAYTTKAQDLKTQKIKLARI